MHFVLYVGQQSEHFACHRHADLFRREPEQQGLCPVLVVFLQSRDRYLQSQLILHRFPDGMHLSQTTVGNDQVRHLSAFVDQVLIASPYYLAHARVVVCALHRLDLKPFVVALARFSHPIDDTPCHRIGALYIRVIEALNPTGQSRETCHLLQFGQNTYASLLRIQFVFLFEPVELILPNVLHSQIQQLLLISTGGNVDMQRIIKYVRNERNNHVLRMTLQLLSQFHHSHRQQLLFLFFHLAAILDRLSAYDTSAVHMQHRYIDTVILLVVSEHIHIFCR